MAEREAVVAVFSEAAATAMAEHRSLAGEHVEAGTARAEEGAEAGAAAEQQHVHHGNAGGSRTQTGQQVPRM